MIGRRNSSIEPLVDRTYYYQILSDSYELDDYNQVIEKEDIERELGDVQEVSQYVQELEATRKYLENIVRRMIRLREQVSGRRYSEIIEKARDYIGQN